MMSGCGILTNGKGTRREYGEYNLDELSVSNSLFNANFGVKSYYHNCHLTYYCDVFFRRETELPW